MTRTAPSRSVFLGPRAVPALCLLMAAALVLSSCAVPESSTAPEAPESPAPTGPALHLVVVTDAGALRIDDARVDSSRVLARRIGAATSHGRSPDGQRLALSYAGPDSTHVALLEGFGTDRAPGRTAWTSTARLTPVAARPGRWDVSAAWAPEGHRLAFAFAPAANGARAPGDVFITEGAAVRSVGCSAAHRVLAWLPNGRLVTRDAANLYVVDADGCATRSRVDARRMHHIRIAPGGDRMAFIHRELVYDRSEGAYVPDSSLVLSALDGSDRQELFGDERRIRHLRWSPDGTELAFDAQLEGAAHRQVVTYNVARDETVYLVPPQAVSGADQIKPRWAPSGSLLAFTLREDGTDRAAVQVQGQLRRLAPVSGSVWGWADDRTVVATGPDSLRVVNLRGTVRYAAPRPATLLHVQVPPAGL